MIVTKLEPYTRNRFKVYLDGEFAFLLYRKELKEYRVTEGEELAGEDYAYITEVLLSKRAKLRAMELLKTKTYTRKQLKDKLLLGFYSEELAEEALAYVESFHYVDDLTYAQDYIRYQCDKRSKMRMKQDLMQKGISPDLIEQAYREVAEVDQIPPEENLIRQLLTKKHFDMETATYEEVQKMKAFLYRKGFSGDTISRVLRGEDY